jgi:glutathione S-transferase
MSLTLYYHPLASFCWKVLIALYENETPFVPHLVDLGNPEARAAFLRLTPLGQFPLLRDDGHGGQLVPESSIIIEYLGQRYPGASALVPADPAAALEARLRDRFFDLHVHVQMQKIVGDKIRPADARDAHGVAQARETLRTAYGMLETLLAGRAWAAGDTFTIADCAAAPALYYANRVEPLGERHPHVAAYLDRLHQRPSFARTFAEAQPYLHLFPG